MLSLKLTCNFCSSSSRILVACLPHLYFLPGYWPIIISLNQYESHIYIVYKSIITQQMFPLVSRNTKQSDCVPPYMLGKHTYTYILLKLVWNKLVFIDFSTQVLQVTRALIPGNQNIYEYLLEIMMRSDTLMPQIKGRNNP